MYLNRSKRYTVETEKKNKDMKAKSEPEMDSKHGVLDALKSLNTTLQVLVFQNIYNSFTLKEIPNRSIFLFISFGFPAYVIFLCWEQESIDELAEANAVTVVRNATESQSKEQVKEKVQYTCFTVIWQRSDKFLAIYLVLHCVLLHGACN